MWLNGDKKPSFVDHEGLRVEDLVNQPELSVQPKIKVSVKDIYMVKIQDHRGVQW